MNIFKKKKEEEVDNRTELEKKFEEKGQTVGRKTGKLVQKGLNKFNKVYKNLEDEGKIDKVKGVVQKVEDKIEHAVETATIKGKQALKKAKNKKNTEPVEEEEVLYYE